MKKLLQIFTRLFIVLFFCKDIYGFNVSLDSVKTVEKPTITVQKPNSTTFCGGEEMKLKYTTTGNYPSDNVFTFNLVYIINTANDPIITRYELGKSTLLSGEIAFKIPTNMIFAYYQLEVSSSNPNVTKIYEEFVFKISQKPQVTLSGTTVANSGISTLLNLISNSGGRYQYILSDSTQGEMIYSKSYIGVKPTKTTVYKFLSVYNECGVGKSSGSATITVNPRSEKSVETDFNEIFRFSESYPWICSGATYTVNFKTSGNFSATNKFTVQMSDENGENFKDVVTEETDFPLRLRFTTPDDLKPSIDYRIRVVASDKDVSSSANLFPLIRSGKGPTASFESLNYPLEAGKPVNIKINLTGKSPWNIIFGNDEKLAKYYYGITESPFIISITPNKTDTYRIFELSNGCPGKVTGTNAVRVELITANQELPDLAVKLFPNPTSDKITIQSDHFKNTSLQILDNLGRQILQQNITQSQTVLDVSNFKTGQYLLQIEKDNKRNVCKIIKL
jgi:hypothetical protein